MICESCRKAQAAIRLTYTDESTHRPATHYLCRFCLADAAQRIAAVLGRFLPEDAVRPLGPIIREAIRGDW